MAPARPAPIPQSGSAPPPGEPHTPRPAQKVVAQEAIREPDSLLGYHSEVAVKESAAVTRRATRATSARTGSRRRRFGGGMVDIAPIVQADPTSAVMPVAEVPEDKRFCARCNQAVGRGRDGRPGRTQGFCPSCGEAFDVTPKLRKGDLVGGQYEVVGPLAHGGLGWIYLAVDKNVSDRWVVLKGILNSGDEDALAAAVAERRFLAEVEHPNIVKIYNFVEHDGAGYIVMEYVGGESLKDMLKQRRYAAGGRTDPLPVDQALAYVLEIMPAFGYLHDRGLIFCDFKPDNVIQTGDQVKLIDLGGVAREDDFDAAIYGTVGFQAPEIAADGPSAASDIYTIGRTLAVLTTDFRGYQSTYATSLPPRDASEVYLQHESFYRLLVRATRPEPGARFADAAEMAEQMLGVLREVLAASGDPRPATSRQFTGEMFVFGNDTPDWRQLPAPIVDLTDPAAAYLASVTVTDPQQVLTLLVQAPAHTVEVQLRALRAMIDLGAATYADHPGLDVFAHAKQTRDALAASVSGDWRVAWYDGVLGLASGDLDRARQRFEEVYSSLPGEPAPKLGLALALEMSSDHAAAAGYYDVVSRTDPSYTTASAGLARCRLAIGDRGGAVEAYNRVPGTSAAYHGSQVGAVRALVRPHHAASADVAALAAAAELIGRLEVEAAQVAALRAELLEQALIALGAGRTLPPAVLGLPPGPPLSPGPHSREAPVAGPRSPTPPLSVDERQVRFALESAYREMAQAAHGPEKVRLVDQANSVRPRTRT